MSVAPWPIMATILGPIIISDKDGQKFIIDGQQRLTTLTLLLIYLHHRLQELIFANLEIEACQRGYFFAVARLVDLGYVDRLDNGTAGRDMPLIRLNVGGGSGGGRRDTHRKALVQALAVSAIRRPPPASSVG